MTRDTMAEASKPDSDWIEWSGGECPVEPSAVVQFKCRDGYIATHTAANLAGEDGRSKTNWWSHTETRRSGRDDDIIAYRVVQSS